MKSARLVVCAVAGSLRKASYNRALLRVAQEVAPADMEIRIFERIGELPHYDEDVERRGDPEPVEAWKRAIAEADALLIATPEYNQGVPGVLKNAIDWASRPEGRSVLARKPTAIFGASIASTGSARAQSQLRQDLVLSDVPVLVQPEVLVNRAHEKFDAELRLTDAKTRDYVTRLLVGLADWTRRLTRPL